MAPILEEALFRGIIQEYLSRTNGWLVSIVFTAFLFSLSHLSVQKLLSTFIGDLLMGGLYYRAQSLVCAMIAHSVLNMIFV